MKRAPTNVAASVHARLLTRARAEHRNFNDLLQYYVMERFLYRLSRSKYADRFILKGGLMLQLWGGQLTRATRDIDLLGREPGQLEELEDVLRAVVATVVDDDGIVFDPDAIAGQEIRLATHYQGVRIRATARLGNAVVRFHIDIGFGDVVTPGPLQITYPTLLDFKGPGLLGYTPETAIAEKLQAMIDLDMANTRMKDFLDIWSLAMGTSFGGRELASAIDATFRRRRTPLPDSTPIALTPVFIGSTSKKAQWRGYLRKAHIEGEVPDLEVVAEALQEFLMPVLTALASDVAFDLEWVPRGPWRTPTPRAPEQPAEPCP